MLSVYLRPWVLHRKHASPHVPHIADLDICVSDLLQAERVLRQRRMSVKTHVPGVGRNFATAWQQYRSAHVVSQHAARTIRNFLATCTWHADVSHLSSLQCWLLSLLQRFWPQHAAYRRFSRPGRSIRRQRRIPTELESALPWERTHCLCLSTQNHDGNCGDDAVQFADAGDACKVPKLDAS